MRDFAKLVGVSHTAIASAVDQGRLRTHDVPHRRWPMLDLEEATRDWAATRTAGHNNRYGELECDLFGGSDGSDRPEVSDDPLDGKLGSPESWGAEKVKQEALFAKEKRLRAELERQELEGALHRAEDVEAVWSDILVRCRQRVLGIPSKGAPIVARLSDPAACERELDLLVREALSELSEYSEQKPGIEEARRKRK